MNVFELIRRDHRQIDGLLERLQRAPGEADFDEAGRLYLRDRLVSVASRHEAAEELVLWPLVRCRLAGGARLADQALQAERDAKAILDLLRVTTSEAELIDVCGQLHTVVLAHATFEEDTVFPELSRHSTRLGAALTGIRFGLARRGGPTRPHPKGPDRPVGLLTRGAPAVLVDHLRDLRSRPRRHPVGFEDPGRPDAIAVIREDHDRIGALLARTEAQADPEDSLVQAIIRETAIHDGIERQHLYPVVRDRLQDGHTRYEQLMGEHRQIGRLASNLDAYRFHDEARREWVHGLAVHLRTHMEQEEAAVLPALAARMTPEELIDLGSRLEGARAKAPTRPHPHMSGAGAGARLLGIAAGPIDRARDLLSGRRTA